MVTAYFLKSGVLMVSNKTPPLAWGLAPILFNPVGAILRISFLSFPDSSNSSSG